MAETGSLNKNAWISLLNINTEVCSIYLESDVMAESGAEKDTLEEHLEKTDLMQTHYSNEEFNSYSSGPGSRLPRQQQINRGVSREASRENIKLYIGTWPLDLTEQAVGNLFSNVCK
ncbi:hypothetical protein CAPTEDRAFT_207842, partial [Capitella teleta]